MPKNSYLLTSKKAAEILGVHESSVKRWSNLGELPSKTTQGGHRRIAWDDFMFYANQHGIVHAYTHFDARALAVYVAKESYQKDFSLTPFADLINAWMEEGHLTSLDHLLIFMVEQLKISFIKIVDELIFPSMVLMGQWWEQGKIDIVQEHRLSQEWDHAINVLRHTKKSSCLNKSITHKKAILACSDENTHELALHCLRILLEERNFEVVFLGARLPDDQLKVCVEKEKPALVAVSFSLLDDDRAIQRTYKTLASLELQQQPFILAFGGGKTSRWDNVSDVEDRPSSLNPTSRSIAKFGHFKSMKDFCFWLESEKT